MDDPDFLNSARIAIIGLGLMGGSLALALKGHCKRIWGYDPDESVLQIAEQQEVVERVSANLKEILQDSDLIVFAAPVRAIVQTIRELPDLTPESAVVLDLGSSKRQIVAEMQKLPARFDPIGGHPMCGKEKLGLVNADPGLFQGAPFAFTRLERTSRRAQHLALEISQAIGAHPLWLDADLHDQWTAATSHLPYLLACALVMATPLEAAPMAGPGFRSMTRLTATPTSMMFDVLNSNQDYILESISRFKGKLGLIEALLQKGDQENLGSILAESTLRKSKFDTSSE